MSKKIEKKHNFHEKKKFRAKFFSGNVKPFSKTTAEIISSISQTFFTEGSKMQESVFLTTSVVFLEQSSKYIGFSFEALAKLFRQRSSFFFTESPKTCKKLDISQKSVFLQITLHWTLWKQFRQPCRKASPKVRRKFGVCKNYKTTQFWKKVSPQSFLLGFQINLLRFLQQIFSKEMENR